MDDVRSVLPSSAAPNSGQFSTGLGPASHPDDERDALFIKLLFAARRLADKHIRPYSAGHICEACQGVGVLGKDVEHFPACAVGHVVLTIERIASLYEQRVEAAAIASPAPRTEAVAAGEFGEPWSVDSEDPTCVRNAEGLLVVDGYGSELFDTDEELHATRITACVNACAGVSTEALIRNARKPKLHGMDALFGQKAPAAPEPPEPPRLHCSGPIGLGIARDLAKHLDPDTPADKPQPEVKPFEYPEAEGGAK